MLRNSMSRLIIYILLIRGAPSVNAGDGDHRDRTLRVMTRNMDLGSDFGYIFEVLATNPSDQSALLLAITKTYLEVLASHIPQRADALAAEIQTTQPDLVALQEVSTVSTGPFGAPATIVVVDQLDALLDALNRRGLHYAPVVINKNTDVTLPSLDASFQHLMEVRLVDSDVVLARTDLSVSELKLENLQKGTFAAAIVLPIAGTNVTFPSGWIAIDVKLRGKTYRFVDTHLETLSPVQAAQTSELLSGPLNTDLPVVLAGDLNSDAHAPSFANGPAYGMLVSAGFLDVWNMLHPNDAGLTWPLFGEDPPLGPTSLIERIDLIFTKGSGIQATGILRTGTTAPFASDHVGLVADFTLFP
jgi:endonuclease/exonuclease/phosphatase family metal-dependent hydrolase